MAASFGLRYMEMITRVFCGPLYAMYAISSGRWTKRSFSVICCLRKCFMTAYSCSLAGVCSCGCEHLLAMWSSDSLESAR